MRIAGRSLGPRHWFAAGLFVLLLAFTVYALLISTARAAPEEPFAFNHEIMVQSGIQCPFCHADVFRSPAAGMPSMEKCMGCHRVIAANIPEIQRVAAYYAAGKAIPWPRIIQMPRFVYFSHEVHVSNGVNCEDCHGDVGHMTVTTQNTKNMNMGWCLGCHTQQPNAPQLKECLVCHQ